MKIDTLSFTQYSPTIKGKIIDSHVHCGKWNYDYFPSDEIAKNFDKKFNNGKDSVDKVFISNLSCIKMGENKKPLENEIDGNLYVIKAALKNKKLLPFVVCQPGFGAAENIELLLQKFPDIIKGMKFHPTCLNLQANNEKYFPYMQLAEKYRKPCLFHSEVDRGLQGNYVRTGVSDPDYIYDLAKNFPQVSVILGHMGLGGDEANEICIKTLMDSIEKGDAKLYADLAWVDCNNPLKPHIIDVIKKLKNSSKGDMTERLLFGTDAPLGAFGEKAYKKLGAYGDNIKNIKDIIKENFGDEAGKFISRIFYRNSKKLIDNFQVNKLV